MLRTKSSLAQYPSSRPTLLSGLLFCLHAPTTCCCPLVMPQEYRWGPHLIIFFMRKLFPGELPQVSPCLLLGFCSGVLSWERCPRVAVTHHCQDALTGAPVPPLTPAWAPAAPVLLAPPPEGSSPLPPAPPRALQRWGFGPLYSCQYLDWPSANAWAMIAAQ